MKQLNFIYSLVWFSLLMSTLPASSQNDHINLKYLGNAGWEMSDDSITILVDPYISRLKLGSAQISQVRLSALDRL